MRPSKLLSYYYCYLFNCKNLIILPQIQSLTGVRILCSPHPFFDSIYGWVREALGGLKSGIEGGKRPVTGLLRSASLGALRKGEAEDTEEDEEDESEDDVEEEGRTDGSERRSSITFGRSAPNRSILTQFCSAFEAFPSSPLKVRLQRENSNDSKKRQKKRKD